MSARAADPDSRLDGFFAVLKARGFFIGAEQILRVHSLLDLMPPASADELRERLCPLLATSEAEQDSFLAAFDECFAERPLVLPREIKAVTPPRRRRWWMLALAVAALAVAFLFVRHRTPREKALPAPPTATPIPAVPGLVESAPVPVQPPADSRFAISPRTKRILQFSLPALPFLLWALLAVVRKSRRRRLAVRRRAANNEAPFTWPITFDQRPQIHDFRLPPFQRVVRKLRRRQTVEGRRLDLAATMRATMRRAGYPTFAWRPDSRVPEYLVLIDRAAWNDHAAAYFADLTEALESEGLLVERWFFEGDARACHDAAGRERRLLGELERRFAGHRLLLLTSGAGLLDPLRGTLLAWTSRLEGWTERALLTPLPPEAWGPREERLVALVPLFPATIAGLERVADRWASEGAPRTDFAAPDPDTWDAFDTPANLDRLRARLGPAFPWAAACAMYPDLNWELTLRLGSLPELGSDLVNEENILSLVRVPWFREGRIPPAWAAQLADAPDVPPEARAAVRTALLAILQQGLDDPRYAGSAAHESRTLEIAVNAALVESLPAADRQKARAFLRERGEADRIPGAEMFAAQAGPLPLLLPWRFAGLLRTRLPAPLRWALSSSMVALLAAGLLAWGVSRLPEKGASPDTANAPAYTTIIALPRGFSRSSIGVEREGGPFKVVLGKDQRSASVILPSPSSPEQTSGTLTIYASDSPALHDKTQLARLDVSGLNSPGAWGVRLTLIDSRRLSVEIWDPLPSKRSLGLPQLLPQLSAAQMAHARYPGSDPGSSTSSSAGVRQMVGIRMADGKVHPLFEAGGGAGKRFKYPLPMLSPDQTTAEVSLYIGTGPYIESNKLWRRYLISEIPTGPKRNVEIELTVGTDGSVAEPTASEAISGRRLMVQRIGGADPPPQPKPAREKPDLQHEPPKAETSKQ